MADQAIINELNAEAAKSICVLANYSFKARRELLAAAKTLNASDPFTVLQPQHTAVVAAATTRHTSGTVQS